MAVNVILQKCLYNPTKWGFGGVFPLEEVLLFPSRVQTSLLAVPGKKGTEDAPGSATFSVRHASRGRTLQPDRAGGSSGMPSITWGSGRPPASQMPCARGRQRTGAMTRKMPPATFSPWAASAEAPPQA